MTGVGFTAAERRRVRVALAGSGEPACPACGTLLVRRPVDRPDLSYVRHRVLLVCPGCQRSGGFDLPDVRP